MNTFNATVFVWRRISKQRIKKFYRLKWQCPGDALSKAKTKRKSDESTTQSVKGRLRKTERERYAARRDEINERRGKTFYGARSGFRR